MKNFLIGIKEETKKIIIFLGEMKNMEIEIMNQLFVQHQNIYIPAGTVLEVQDKRGAYYICEYNKIIVPISVVNARIIKEEK